MALTRVKHKFQVTIPTAVRTAAGLQLGDLLDARVQRGLVVLRPKVLHDRPTLAQFKKDIEASKAAVKAGRVLGPFDNARDAMRALRNFAKKQRRGHARTPD